MTNLMFFGISVVAYFGIWFLFRKSTSVRGHMKRIGLLALLCVPFNVGGNVFTVLGSAKSEKSVYSFFSLYQEAGQDAITVLGLMPYQKAGRNAIVGVGLAGFQEANQDTLVPVGFVGYQKADQDAAVGIGLTGLQKAGRRAWVLVGLVGYQKADQDARTDAALVGYQKVCGKERAFAVWSSLTCD